MEDTLEIKWYGRARQVVMSTAAVLADVLAMEGKYVQTVPDFHNGKNSVLFQAYNRLSNSPVKLHSAVLAADVIVIMDPALILNTNTDVKAHAKGNAIYFVNTFASSELIKEKLAVGDNQIFTLDTKTFFPGENGNRNHAPNVPLITVLIQWIDWISIETFKQRLHQALSPMLTPTLVSANVKIVDTVATEFENNELKKVE